MITMLFITVLFTSCIIGVAAVQADSKCSGNPPMYNGKPCASTTNYVDGHKGACGCGPEGGDAQVINGLLLLFYCDCRIIESPLQLTVNQRLYE